MMLIRNSICSVECLPCFEVLNYCNYRIVSYESGYFVLSGIDALLPGVVKRIIPAVASTNAVIAGEVIYFKIPVCINSVLCRPTRASDVNIDL